MNNQLDNFNDFDGVLPPQPNLLQAQQMQQAIQAQQIHQQQQQGPEEPPLPGPLDGGRFKKSRKYKKSKKHK